TWTRYHLVRDCLRHQDGAMAGDDLCARISKAIENEQPERHRRFISPRWLKPASGLAIAASVALMAITVVGPGRLGTTLPNGEVAEGSGVQQFTSPQSLTPAPASNQVSLSGGLYNNDAKMNAYLLRHYQASGATGRKGFVPYIPMVTIGTKLSDEAEQAKRKADPETSEEEDSGSR
ncbi:sigma-E factor negative regulatory protein, partial [Pseudomonadota bacterium]